MLNCGKPKCDCGHAECRSGGGVFALKLCPRLCLCYQLLSDCVCTWGQSYILPHVRCLSAALVPGAGAASNPGKAVQRNQNSLILLSNFCGFSRDWSASLVSFCIEDNQIITQVSIFNKQLCVAIYYVNTTGIAGFRNNDNADRGMFTTSLPSRLLLSNQLCLTNACTNGS